MSDPRNISIEEYDYQLPASRIAQYPLQNRDASRLLFYNKGLLTDRRFTDLPDLLPYGSFLVFNDTRVIRARFVFNKSSGARIEIFCLEPIAPTASLQQAFASKHESYWKCYVGNLKKWKKGFLTLTISGSNYRIVVRADKTGLENDTVNIKFTWNNPDLSFSEIMEACGHIPLPPYITRSDDNNDVFAYQTIYARQQGSVAAPTAGLHFTEKVMNELQLKEIEKQYITLHVGAGTFKPVSAGTIGLHNMHHENYSVSRNFILKLLEHKGKPVFAVGTTSMRTLESLYWLGVRLIKQGKLVNMITSQWEPYENKTCNISVENSLMAVLDFLTGLGNTSLFASTGLLIAPGYKFKICDGLITNFHLPKSTLLLLVAALIGSDWRKAYEFALDRNFRFLSYGDSCLFFPKSL